MSRFVFFIRNILIFLDYNFIDFRIDQFQTKISVFRVAAFQFQFSSVRSFYFLTCFNRIVQCVGKQCTKTDIVDMDYTNDGRITAIEIKSAWNSSVTDCSFLFCIVLCISCFFEKSREDCKLKLKISLQSSIHALY